MGITELWATWQGLRKNMSQVDLVTLSELLRISKVLLTYLFKQRMKGLAHGKL